MRLKTTVKYFADMEVAEDKRLKGFNKAIKFDNKLRVSPAIFFPLKDHKGMELDMIVRSVPVLDMDDPDKVKENMKILPKSLLGIQTDQ